MIDRRHRLVLVVLACVLAPAPVSPRAAEAPALREDVHEGADDVIGTCWTAALHPADPGRP